ncbi:MAG: hypothetical protein FOGNACKC_00940 [Anaerolineae bacterium]|nr:hypothetical protein [Anaerolineae bacterium]
MADSVSVAELAKYCNETATHLIQGLAEGANIYPHMHYVPLLRNSSRVLVVTLARIRPAFQRSIFKMQKELTQWAGLPHTRLVRIGWDKAGINIEIPKPRRFWALVTVDHLQRRKAIPSGHIITLGIGLSDEPKRIDFRDATTGHILLGGQTRSGKTTTQRTIAWNVAHNTLPGDAKMLLIDTEKKGNDPYEPWRDFEYLQHMLHPLVTEVDEAELVLGWLVGELGRRAGNGQKEPRIYVFVDELRGLLANGSATILSHLARLSAAGAGFGIHLNLATQYPQIGLLGGGADASELKRNMTHRLCGRVDSAESATNILGLGDSGGELLAGKGDFLMRDQNGLSRLTVARASEQNISRLPRLDTPNRLDLSDVALTQPVPANRLPDEFTTAEQAFALFTPGRRQAVVSVDQLRTEFSMGSGKAQRLKKWVEEIREWAEANGYNSLP